MMGAGAISPFKKYIPEHCDGCCIWQSQWKVGAYDRHYQDGMARHIIWGLHANHKNVHHYVHISHLFQSAELSIVLFLNLLCNWVAGVEISSVTKWELWWADLMGCLEMGCWTVIKSLHVKIILLDKQELIQEIQVCSWHTNEQP